MAQIWPPAGLRGACSRRSKSRCLTRPTRPMKTAKMSYFYLPLLYTKTLMNVVVVVSLWIFTPESVLECPVSERLFRAPRDRPRPRDRTTPAPHDSPRGRRRKNGRQRQIRRAGSGERRKEPSPVSDMAGDRKNMGKHGSPTTMQQHNVCMNELTYCRLSLIHI